MEPTKHFLVCTLLFACEIKLLQFKLQFNVNKIGIKGNANPQKPRICRIPSYVIVFTYSKLFYVCLNLTRFYIIASHELTQKKKRLASVFSLINMN